MPWRDKLRQLKQDWRDALFPSQKPSQPQFTTPIKKYWEPAFEPENLVNTDWLLKKGNGSDGWGNKELQHYSSDGANSFQYAHPFFFSLFVLFPKEQDACANAAVLLARRTGSW